MGTSRWLRHQLVRGIIGDYHGLFISCAARDITKRTDGCSAPGWFMVKFSFFILALPFQGWILEVFKELIANGND